MNTDVKIRIDKYAHKQRNKFQRFF